MKNILIVNGANLNLQGLRQPDIYGSTSFADYFVALRQHFAAQVHLVYRQSNAEGVLIDCIHAAYISNHKLPISQIDDFSDANESLNALFASTPISGIVLNAGGYSHTSVALRDAIAAIDIPVIEVHISNIYAREDFRRQSLLSPVCQGQICGLGLKGYQLAIEALL